MPTRKEKGLNSNIPKLGVIAGAGIIPVDLLYACQLQDIETVSIGIKGSTDCLTPDFWSRVGTSAKTLKIFQDQNIKDIVMIGAVKRPNFFEFWPDWVTAKFFFKAWMKSFGDDSLLSAMRAELESMGFRIHGIQKFLPELLMPEGLICGKLPTDLQGLDIQLGLKASQELGRQDIGQAVIVKNGQVIGCEDKKGTSALIRKYGREGAILVKSCKPQQDKDLDLPTIGPETVKLCAGMGMAGIIAQAGHSLLVEKKFVEKIAGTHGIFVMGVTIDPIKHKETDDKK